MNKKIKNKKLKRKTNYQKETDQTLCNELRKFFIKLASKQKTVPFEFYE